MAYGVTPTGFVIKRLDIIKAEIEQAIRDALGNGINLLPTEFLGQLVGIQAEREAKIWELAEGVYYSQYPSTADGINLDNVVSITGIKRLEATRGTGTGIAYGTETTVIPAGSIVSVNGNADARFVTLAEAIIGPGTNEQQLVAFSAVPDAGNWTLSFDGEQTGLLLFSSNAAAVAAALNGLSNLSGVTVSGNYTSGFTVTFAGADGEQDQLMLQVASNTLTNTAVAVNIVVTETVKGVLPNISVALEAEDAGAIPAYANTLTVIETPIAGWDLFNNPADITMGKNIESDPELRIRRLRTLSTYGWATVEAIRSRVLSIDEVEDARVYENVEAFVVSGRPAKSVQVIVLGGDNQEIADTIFAVKAAGIETFGVITEIVVDSQGTSHSIEFSRPTAVPIYVIINVVANSDFPIGGDVTMRQLLADYGTASFSIGDDVLHHKLFCPLDNILGVVEMEILIGIAPGPTLENNIVIGDVEISDWDTANITVNVTP